MARPGQGIPHHSSGIQNSPPRSLGDGRGPRGDAQLAKDVGEMTMDRVVAHEESFGDRLIVEAVGDEAQHFDFALGQAAASHLDVRLQARS